MERGLQMLTWWWWTPPIWTVTLLWTLSSRLRNLQTATVSTLRAKTISPGECCQAHSTTPPLTLEPSKFPMLSDNPTIFSIWSETHRSHRCQEISLTAPPTWFINMVRTHRLDRCRRPHLFMKTRNMGLSKKLALDLILEILGREVWTTPPEILKIAWGRFRASMSTPNLVSLWSHLVTNLHPPSQTEERNLERFHPRVPRP